MNTAIQLLISHPTDYSFPSGHTAASFTAVAALYFSGDKKIWKAAIVLGILIAFSRMYLYVHYPTDILGGILVGIFSGFIGSKIVTYMMKKGRIRMNRIILPACQRVEQNEEFDTDKRILLYL